MANQSASASSRSAASTIAVAAMVAAGSPPVAADSSSMAGEAPSAKAKKSALAATAVPPAKRVVSSHLPRVTVADIRAAVDKLENPRNGAAQQVVIGGRSANSLAQIQEVVRQLAKVGRLDEEALLLLAEEDAVLAETTAQTVLSDLEHVMLPGDTGSEFDGHERDVYYGPWRLAVVTAVTPAAAPEADAGSSESETPALISEG